MNDKVPLSVVGNHPGARRRRDEQRTDRIARPAEWCRPIEADRFNLDGPVSVGLHVERHWAISDQWSLSLVAANLIYLQ